MSISTMLEILEQGARFREETTLFARRVLPDEPCQISQLQQGRTRTRAECPSASRDE